VELFVESLSCKFAEITASSPFMCIIHATYLHVIDGYIEVRLGNVYETWLSTTHVKRLLMFDIQVIKTTFGLVIWIAPIEEIHVLALKLQSNIAENNREFWRSTWSVILLINDSRHAAKVYWISDLNVTCTNYSNTVLKMVSKRFALELMKSVLWECHYKSTA